MPKSQKVCNFDCVYCQYASERTANAAFPTVLEIETEAAAFLDAAKKNDRVIDWITIAGNGEPTLHPQFGEAVERLLLLRDKLLPGVRVGILSNSSTCRQLHIRRALNRLDGRFMKLDAGNPSIFKDVNRPSGIEGWERMVAGLRGLRDAVLQSLFFDGIERNTAPSQVGDWIGLVEQIQPRSVQVYTIDRSTQLEGLQRVSAETLWHIASELTARTGIPADIY